MEWQSKDARLTIEDLRRRFLKLKGDYLHEFDSRDISRLRNDDQYLWLFLLHQNHEIDKALSMLIECLQWRESFGINDLTERSIDRRLFEIGFFYPRNRDRNGNPLILFHAHLYKKELHDPDEVKNLIGYGIEKMWQQNRSGRVSIVFNMQDAGLANMDMVLIKFVILCFQIYYPTMLEYLVIFETPWILTAAWKIVKTWLSTEGISKIKFVNKTEVTQFIDNDQLLTCMGGSDTFEYTYPPQLFTGKVEFPPLEERSELRPTYESSPITNRGLTGAGINREFSDTTKSRSSTVATVNDGSTDEFNLVNRRLQNGEMISSIEYSLTDSNPNPKNVKQTEENSKNTKREGRKLVKRDKLEHVGPLVTICPCSELVFCGSSRESGEILQILTISNTVSSTVAFKVKTTTPDNYRVRPSSGPIQPGSTAEVHVYLQPGGSTSNSMSRDKFLVLTTVVPDQENLDLQTLWKMIPKSSIMEHRMRCRFEMTLPSPPTSGSSSGKNSDRDQIDMLAASLSSTNQRLSSLEERFSIIERRLQRTLNLLIFISLLFLMPIILYTLYNASDIFTRFI